MELFSFEWISSLAHTTMKIINLTLIFFGILTQAYIPRIPLNSCLKVPGMPNFDAKRYFQGTWFVTHVQHGIASSVCRTIKTSLKPNGSLEQITYGYSLYGTLKRFYKIHCKDNESTFLQNGNVSLVCLIKTDSIKVEKIFRLKGVVIETDYDHFSIFYRCAWDSEDIGDNVVILSREKSAYPVEPKLEETLENFGLSIDDFVSRDDFNCKTHPEE